MNSWNEAISTIQPEDEKWRELSDSFQRNPPGRVVLTPDVRAEQRRRRLKLVEDIITLHRRRIQHLEDLARAEKLSH